MRWTHRQLAKPLPLIRDRITAHRHHLALLRLGLILVVLLVTGCAATPGLIPRVELPSKTDPAIVVDDLRAHVAALTDPRMAGRRTGTRGEALAADYVARAFAAMGLEPAGTAASWFERFEFTSGLSLGPGNQLNRTGQSPLALRVDKDWRPLAFSQSGTIAPAELVFAGYGLVAAAEPEIERQAIDDYAGLDVSQRWVLVFRGLPQTLSGEDRPSLLRKASLRHKAMVARDRGARGILFVSGPEGRFEEELVPLRFDASLSGTRIAAISLTDAATERLLGQGPGSLKALQRSHNARYGEAPPAPAYSLHPHGQGDSRPSGPYSFPTKIEFEAQIDLVTERSEGTNVIGRLPVGESPSSEMVMLGAHFDHLGRGASAGSLARKEERDKIHPGADDNASGTALLIEVAEFLAAERAKGTNLGRRDFVFAAWSGEELGLLGSHAFAEDHSGPGEMPVAYLNFDMVGRLREALLVHGLGSSPDWPSLLESAAAGSTIKVQGQQDSYVPTDSISFYSRGIPTLNAFTGIHGEYHTPRDEAETLNFEGIRDTAALFADIASRVSRAPSPPRFQEQRASGNTPHSGPHSTLNNASNNAHNSALRNAPIRGGFRVYLGSIPDYAQTDGVGVRLSGVAPEGPAARAGLQGRDVIVEVDGQSIENLYDYTYALEKLRVGVPAQVAVERAGQRLEFEVVPGSRD